MGEDVLDFFGLHLDLPGYKVPTVDLTGAGDTFAAAFFTRATDKSVSAINAGRYANAVAALSLRGIGATGIPTKKEVEAFSQGCRGARTVPLTSSFTISLVIRECH